MPEDEHAQAPKFAPHADELAVDREISVPRPKLPVFREIWVPERVRGTGEREVSRIAGVQKGFVCRGQVLAAGFTRDAITHRLRKGWLIARYKGVYLVGRPSLEPLGEKMAAILYLRGDAVLSHRSAAEAWGLVDRASKGVTVTIVGRDVRSRPGLQVHRAPTLDGADIRVRDGLPVTAPARTLIDLAAAASPWELERALAEARVQRLVSDKELTHALARAPRRTGVSQLRALLNSPNEPALTRSEAERRLLGLLREARLPAPRTNSRVLGLEVDCHWPEQGLILEIDGHRYHGHRGAFEKDRERDQRLVAGGYRVIRVTWSQLSNESMAVVARLAMALQAAGARAREV